MSVDDLFGRLRGALDAAGVPYMLTGSFASSVHGKPRATHDVDIVIDPSRTQLLALLGHFPEDSYYASVEGALDALNRRSQFNVIDFATGWKVDFIIRKSREFSRVEFDRRRGAQISGLSIDVATAEDVLLAKLEWAKEGASDRQIEDAAGILQAQGERLDRQYVRHWVGELGLVEQWRAAEARASE